MKASISLLLLLGLGLSACSSTKTSTKIPKLEINTETARLNGYLEGIQLGDCAPLCTKTPREVDVKDNVVLDEALLVEAGKNTCFDVTIRTTLSYDQSVSQLQPTCVLDGTLVPADVLTETFTVVAYGDVQSTATEKPGAADSSFTVLAAEMTLSDLHAKAGDETSVSEYYGQADYTAAQLRVVNRSSRICCPGTGVEAVELRLSNGVDASIPQENLAQSVNFFWTLED